jgi:hypothetical protein
VCQLRQARAVVDRRDAERGEPGHVGPAELGARRLEAVADRGHEGGRGGVPQAGPRALGKIDHRDRPGREQRPDELRRLRPVAVGGEPVVDRHHALVGDDVPGDAAADGDGVESLAVAQPVDLRLPGRVGAQHGQDVARLVDRVAAHPGARGVRPPPGGGHLGAERALAPAFDLARARLHQHREVAGQQVGAGPAQPQQPVALGLDLLALVEDVGDVTARRGEVRGQPELDRDPRLHVGRAAAVQPGPLGAGGQVARDRDRVDVPGQDHPLRPPELGAGHDRIAVPGDGKVPERLQRALDGVGQRPLCAADRGNVHQPRGQRRPIQAEIQVQVHPASIGTRHDARALAVSRTGARARPWIAASLDRLEEILGDLIR